MAKKSHNSTLHRRLNDYLTVVIVFVILYIFIAPWVQNLKWQFKSNEVSQSIIEDVKKVNVPDGRILMVPSLEMKETIYEGPSPAELNKGVWRRPNTSTPDAYSNTVLAGHRFRYSSTDAVFYNLDKVKMGDKIYVAWDKTLYTYDVDEIFVVNPSDVWVEDPSKTPVLTLYTCTPLWTSNQRLIIKASLANEEKSR